MLKLKTEIKRKLNRIILKFEMKVIDISISITKQFLKLADKRMTAIENMMRLYKVK